MTDNDNDNDTTGSAVQHLCCTCCFYRDFEPLERGGKCLRNPPVFVGNDGENTRWEQPPVGAFDLCGEYEEVA